MSQSYTPEFKKKIVRLHIEEGQLNHYILTKASLQSMVYQKPVSPNGVLNLAKNAIQKPSRIQMLLMIWNL